MTHTWQKLAYIHGLGAELPSHVFNPDKQVYHSQLLALSLISPKRLERIFLKSLHIIFIMYIKMSETFIKIDPLQHLGISTQTY